MDQLEQIWKTALQRWRALSARQQRRAQLAILAVGILIAGWGLFRATPKYTWLLSGREFSERELTALEGALGQAGLNGYVVEQGRVRVPRDQRASYLGALAEAHALPVHFDLELKDELRRSSPFESQEQRRARLQVTQQRELALILRAMKGIQDATVHLDQSVNGPFHRERRMTAMVVVRPRPDQPLDMSMIRSIRHLVAASKVDLKPEDVTVTDLETGSSFAGGLDDSALARADELALMRMSYERDYRRKLERLLTFIPGVQVAVNVDLQYRAYPTEAAVAAEPSAATAPVLVPAAVGASIGIPDRFYQIAWREQQRGLPRIERQPLTDSIQSEFRASQDQRVRQLLQGALPADAIVTINAFDDSLARGATSDFWGRWLGALGWQSSLLAALSMMMLAALSWSMLRTSAGATYGSRTTDQADHHAPTTQTSVPAGDHADNSPTNESAHEDYHHELTRIVRQNPDAAAAKLAEWIDKAA